jgi:hypothetical protein
MAQNFTENCFASGNAGLTDLQNMENNFLCLQTLFSGSSAPANTTGGMPWFDTGNKILKIRNSTNGGWLGIHYSGTAARWWVYSNAANDGWVVDSSITDRVCAIKGGSQAYSTTGGSLAGTWTISGVGINNTSHSHKWVSANAGQSVLSYDSTGDLTPFGGSNNLTTATTAVSFLMSTYTADPILTLSTGYYTQKTTVNITFNSSATWRPAAAVGTLQYLTM